MSHGREEKIYHPDDDKSIYGGYEAWDPFFKGIFCSIDNRNSDILPVAKLNDDQSISFFIHKCKETNCIECKDNAAFEQTFGTDYIIEQLDSHRHKFNFSLTSNKNQLIEKNDNSDVTNIIEFRINLSPENLDSILKLSRAYSYRGESNILKLRKNCVLKPGVICLFPVSPLDDTTFVMRAAGCQISEMPSVQLLHLLPDFDGKENYFHWVPKEVQEKLGLSGENFGEILKILLEKQKMTKQAFYLQAVEGTVIITEGDEGPVKIVEMDEIARNFYLLYGNIPLEELKNCKSIEINTDDFFQEIFNYLKTNYDDLKKYGDSQTEYLKKVLISLDTIVTMIENEQNRKERAAISQLKAPGTTAPNAVLHSPKSESAAGAEEKVEKKQNFTKPS